MRDAEAHEGSPQDFDYIVRCDTALDRVMTSLRNAGVSVTDDDRLVVSRWLRISQAVPIRARLAMLRGWLEVDRKRRKGE